MTTSTQPRQTYRIAYRIGGTKNFVWQCMAGTHSGETLRKHRLDIERMGYPTVTLEDGKPLPEAFGVAGWSEEEDRRTGEHF